MTTSTRERVDLIAEAVIGGDEASFRTLYDEMSGSVFNLVVRSVHDRAIAEDICQEVWVKAHREIGALRSGEALTAWLYRIASRACIDYSRSKACRERGSAEITEEMIDTSFAEPESALERQNEMRVMWEVLAAMPPRQSMALYLKQVDGRSYDEIGRILGCPRSAVETLLFRARHGLARTRERFQTDPKASCKMIGATMSVVLDKEGTPIQERAVYAHLSSCKPCREEMSGMKQGMAGYAWLPMLPVGGHALSVALAGGAAGVGAGLGIARIAGLLLIKGKASGLVALTVGAIATTTVAGAVTGLTPSPFEAVREVGTAVRNATVGDSAESESSALKPVESSVLPPLAPIQTQPSGGPAQPRQALPSLPSASQLDPVSALSGLPGLLQSASNGALGSVEPLLAYVGGTLGGLLEDPLAALERLLQRPGAGIAELVGGATGGLNETTQNATQTVDNAVNQTTDIVGGILGENQLSGSASQGVGNTTDAIDQTVGAVTGAVEETTGGLGDTLDGLLGDEGLLGGEGGLLGGLDDDDGLLGGLGPGNPPPGEEEEPPPPPEEEPPCVLIILFCS